MLHDSGVNSACVRHLFPFVGSNPLFSGCVILANMAAENETEKVENAFTSSWNDSEVVFVVEDQELHVHTSILHQQSPVFKATFDGHFKEASQDKITLKDKEFKSMQLFLKTLYPSSMFGEARAPLNDEVRLSILALAEEYQCINLIKQCIDEAKFIPNNVLLILPYAVRYHKAALPEMFKIINWSAPTAKLEEILPDLENKEMSSSNKMLLSKCRFLESSIATMQDVLISLMTDFLHEKRIAYDIEKSWKREVDDHNKGTCSGRIVLPLPLWYPDELPTTRRDNRCSHEISIKEINKTKSCVQCKRKYQEYFIAPFHCSKNLPKFFNMLQLGNEISSRTAVTDQNS